MPLQIMLGDITTVRADAVVTSANSTPLIGPGIDAAIHKVAGASLLRDREAIGRIPVGQAAVTAAGNLDARIVVHAVVPMWRDGTYGESATLRECYANALRASVNSGATSIALPLMGANADGFPRDQALSAAMTTISEFLDECDIMIYLVVADMNSYKLPRNLRNRVTYYIHEREPYKPGNVPWKRKCPICGGAMPTHSQVCSTCGHVIGGIGESVSSEPDTNEASNIGESTTAAETISTNEQDQATQNDSEPKGQSALPRHAKRPAPAAAQRRSDGATRAGLNVPIPIDQETFTQMLERLISECALTDAEFCRRANIDRKFLGRVRRSAHYHPTKEAALASALGLKLSLNQTLDLLGTAGYTLSNSSIADRIVEYFIQQQQWDVLVANEVLFAFNQDQLGHWPESIVDPE